MANLTITNALSQTFMNAVTAAIDAGSGAGKIRVYDGTQPAGPATAVSTQTLLAELTFSDPSFGAATDANPGARITANSITQDSSADASGTATWFRCLDSDNNAVIDGDVGLAGSGANMELTTTTITATNAFPISSLRFDHRETP